MADGEPTLKLTLRIKVLLALTLALSGRAMTLAFIRSAGSSEVGAPPAGWLMPLVGDAVIGLSAFAVAYLILRGRGLFAWTVIVAWNVLGIWDALSAYLVQLSVPWSDFFMIRAFGSSMFFAASALHLVNLWIVLQVDSRSRFDLR
jgi:hypothetical protein